ncbi:MAG: Rrf2 family transcriptional regulator [Pseudomonadota bacterium]
MRLTHFTDLGLRALMLMASDPQRAYSTAEIAAEFGISRNHLTKTIALLAAAGIVETRRGTGGGATLAQPPDQLRLGDLVALLERQSALVECFEVSGGSCVITPSCRLKGYLADAHQQFLDALNRHTLADCSLPAHTQIAPAGDRQLS